MAVELCLVTGLHVMALFGHMLDEVAQGQHLCQASTQQEGTICSFAVCPAMPVLQVFVAPRPSDKQLCSGCNMTCHYSNA